MAPWLALEASAVAAALLSIPAAAAAVGCLAEVEGCARGSIGLLVMVSLDDLDVPGARARTRAARSVRSARRATPSDVLGARRIGTILAASAISVSCSSISPVVPISSGHQSIWRGRGSREGHQARRNRPARRHGRYPARSPHPRQWRPGWPFHAPVGGEQGDADGLLVGAHDPVMAEGLRLRNAQSLLQSERRGRRADLRAVDHEDVAVAAILAPVFGELGEAVQRLVVAAGAYHSSRMRCRRA